MLKPLRSTCSIFTASLQLAASWPVCLRSHGNHRRRQRHPPAAWRRHLLHGRVQRSRPAIARQFQPERPFHRPGLQRGDRPRPHPSNLFSAARRRYPGPAQLRPSPVALPGQYSGLRQPEQHFLQLQRWTADLGHEFALARKVYLTAANPRNGPDACAPDANTSCPPISTSINNEGSVSLRLLLTGSAAHAGNAVPFYFDPTTGGSNIDGDPILPSYPDYRFRAPNLVLLRGTVEHALPKVPFGAYFSVDAAKSSITGATSTSATSVAVIPSGSPSMPEASPSCTCSSRGEATKGLTRPLPSAISTRRLRTSLSLLADNKAFGSSNHCSPGIPRACTPFDFSQGRLWSPEGTAESRPLHRLHQNRHPERSARGAESNGPRRCLSYPCCSGLSTTEARGFSSPGKHHGLPCLKAPSSMGRISTSGSTRLRAAGAPLRACDLIALFRQVLTISALVSEGQFVKNVLSHKLSG